MFDDSLKSNLRERRLDILLESTDETSSEIAYLLIYTAGSMAERKQ
ncbi:MAG: hypothetical protein KIC77_07215 [Clostridiales bacterium]|nr:hypothetical protein [Clostridiales bacterium]